jgi:hypothetical protein
MFIPVYWKSLHAEKNNKYFDLKYLKIYVYLNIFYNFL